MNKKEVEIKVNYNRTTDGEPVHRIEFDGVFYDIIGGNVTERESKIFMMGILGERERICDESSNLVNNEVIRKLLRD